MTYEEIQQFERKLQRAIEHCDLARAEALVRAELLRSPDELIQAIIDRPVDELSIEGWDNIAADMAIARERLPTDKLDAPWAAVLIGLINRNDVEGLPLTVAFVLDATPYVPDVDSRPSYMSDDQFEAWKAEVSERTFLPSAQRHSAYPSAGQPRIVGLDALRAVHARASANVHSRDEQYAVWSAQSIAAAIVLLRFHQLVERYVQDPGLPEPLPVFAHVETAVWPMETGTIDYGTQATRKLMAAADHYDPIVTERIAARVRAEREAAWLEETREVIAAIRELELAWSLWPWWRNREERFRFKLYVESYLGSAQAAVERAAPGRGTRLKGEQLCEAFARLRLGDRAGDALEVPPADRPAMHKLSIAYARKFGGPKIDQALSHVPPPPEALLRTGDYGLP